MPSPALLQMLLMVAFSKPPSPAISASASTTRMRVLKPVDSIPSSLLTTSPRPPFLPASCPGGRAIRAKAVLTLGIDPRCAHLPRPGWKHACKELGLKGYGYDEANPNILVPAEPSDGTYGTPPLRSWRCEIAKED